MSAANRSYIGMYSRQTVWLPNSSPKFGSHRVLSNLPCELRFATGTSFWMLRESYGKARRFAAFVKLFRCEQY